ncbi:MAG: GAF domain-containing protein [Prolixibacteraceae bacterium]|jgi:L-methionine (R)-S-oxide reductase
MKPIFDSVLVKFMEIKSKTENRDQLLSLTAELLRSEISHYDWVGFYLLDPTEQILVLGPFTGKPTEHTRIPVGKGICGQVANSNQTMIVQDVTQQDNYIACSMDVQSEIVVPILKDGDFVAEIDIDSHAYAPFSEEDEQFLMAISRELADYF